MLMPVVWYIALASSIFPRLIRSMKASSSVCIHPHSVMVSSVRPFSFGLPANIGLNSDKDWRRCLYLAMICARVSILSAVLFVMGLNCSEYSLEIELVVFKAISHAAAAQFNNLPSLMCLSVLL